MKKIPELTWKHVNEVGQDCPNLLAIMDLVLSLPATSAICEQGFSNMKNIKQDWRASLSSSTLTDLLRVFLETEPVEIYNPNKAIHLWIDAGQRARRPGICPYGKRNSPDSDTCSSSEND